MSTASPSRDDELLARLQAPPELSDGAESLAYWRRRRQRLPWYRMRARREAARMVLVWERRLRNALVRQRGAPVGIRLSAAVLVARTHFGRWIRRAVLVTAAMTALVLVVLVVPALLVVDLALRAL